MNEGFIPDETFIEIEKVNTINKNTHFNNEITKNNKNPLFSFTLQ